MTYIHYLLLLLASSFLSDDHLENGFKVHADLEKSEISWTGKKVLGEHNGLIKLKDGHLIFTEGVLTYGEFLVDMNTIETLDLKGGAAKKLDGHLKSSDFFDVEKYPEAKFVSTNIIDEGRTGNYTVEGNLTIKGITKTIRFYVGQTDIDVSGRMIIDRTEFDIKYGSGSFFDNLGDKAIDNEFALDIRVVFLTK